MPGRRIAANHRLIATPFLDVPTALGGPLGTAVLRRAPEDFVVREWLGFDADGDGDHVLLKVRKRGANTHWVAQQLARIAHVPVRDVGYAGLKDRAAVTEQSFTLPLRSRVALGEWVGVAGEGFEVIAAAPHRRKLKRGALRGNEFVIVLREFTGSLQALEERLAAIARCGVPNYFGPQRFGRAGNNLVTAERWFSSGEAPPDRLQCGFAISAARAALFNAVLARRVTERTWDRLLPGDIANLDGSGSIFAVDDVDATLNERCAALDIHPTGPLWHGESLAAREVRALEQAVAQEHAVLSAGLARLELQAERRALRVRVGELRWQIDGTDVTLSFRLSKGAFATAVLHEIVANAFAVAGLDAE